ncbi:hypothetical protein BpHYR1_043371 [Brachionus plicatilis]|uniref:Uncharacterized protein n=1 Tax=Brachionus plicatilis TaxID=10195 RepID=A0A3M7RHL8_BRAPC|nr:hypothetical protein BpHYR1_043371 [Brachionus plicatilis]
MEPISNLCKFPSVLLCRRHLELQRSFNSSINGLNVSRESNLMPKNLISSCRFKLSPYIFKSRLSSSLVDFGAILQTSAEGETIYIELRLEINLVSQKHLIYVAGLFHVHDYVQKITGHKTSTWRKVEHIVSRIELVGVAMKQKIVSRITI